MEVKLAYYKRCGMERLSRVTKGAEGQVQI